MLLRSYIATFRFLALLAVSLFVIGGANAQSSFPPSAPLPAWQALGGPKWVDWSGIAPSANGSAKLIASHPAIYRVPDGPKGWYSLGLMGENDGTIDARRWYGIRFDIDLSSQSPYQLTLTLAIPPQAGRHSLLESSQASVNVQGKGWHTVTVPFTDFDYDRGQVYFLKFLKQITLTGHYNSGAGKGNVLLRNVRLASGDAVALSCALRSVPVDGGGTATYPVTITNCTEKPETVALQLPLSGWEAMPAAVAPTTLFLAAGQSKQAVLTVSVPNSIPAGTQETQTLEAVPSNHLSRAVTLKFITLRRLPFPYLVFQQKGWDAVKAKAAQVGWAKTEAADVIEKANSWVVPHRYPNDTAPDGTPSLFHVYVESNLWNCAIAYQLTGDKTYAEKVALFLRRLSDPADGYPKTLHANSEGIPQEGGFFEGCARSYDAIQSANVLSDQDQQNIKQTFRLFIATVEDGLGDGGISNWSVFNLCPAAECALTVQDMVSFNYLMHGPTGVIDQLRYGTMDDGWWYEMSLSYNLGAAKNFTNLALAAKPFGIDLVDEKFPVAALHKVGLRLFETGHFEGMTFGKSGPIKDNYIDIKKMWDGITIYPNYRGVMFGMGDGHEEIVAGSNFDEAYYAYHNPAYAAIIKQGGERDLLYGDPNLPTDTPQLYSLSGHSDDAGITVLRSQTPDRPASEQIQVAMKNGTHGGYHGHFDNAALISLMRYGRSFYNPETSWFGYGSYMYKWWVQTSLASNMVVVDQKMQEPVEPKPLLFYSGPILQASATETDARWSNPPYFGGNDQIAQVLSGNAPYVPIPANHPQPGAIGPYTEPVRQRRLILVTDDYVVIDDDLQAAQTHLYDNLLHLRGAALDDPSAARFLGHTPQLNADPLGSGQFITNCNAYQVTAPAIIHSIQRFAPLGKDGQNLSFDNWETGGQNQMYNTPGVLQIDEHVLWPQNPEIVIGDYAEWWNVSKRLQYDVIGDGKTLASGAFGAWILGRDKVDVNVTGLKTLQLTTQATESKGTLKTIFWGDPVIITADGKQIPLSQLKMASVNINPGQGVGKDYEGGPVRIAGTAYPNAVPAEPADSSQAGSITVDLTGLNAVRFQAHIGGDWPVGDGSQVRKVCDIRSDGSSGRFLTLLEPYETTPKVKSASAVDPDTIRVTLTDGRVQVIHITGLAGDGQNIVATFTETKNGQIVRTDTTAAVPEAAASVTEK